ncbi:hypothetical protein ACMT4L_12005 [Deinococcus sp. A31D244]|uniref:hypothetical protein n=1 Tax=Deinococcus sp. A31D244 TaxID=3397675 RepID=UPI0039E11635
MLGLLHPDGTPVTFDDCMKHAQKHAAEGARLTAERNALLRDMETDGARGVELRGLDRDLDRAQIVADAWLGLARAALLGAM